MTAAYKAHLKLSVGNRNISPVRKCSLDTSVTSMYWNAVNSRQDVSPWRVNSSGLGQSNIIEDWSCQERLNIVLGFTALAIKIAFIRRRLFSSCWCHPFRAAWWASSFYVISYVHLRIANPWCRMCPASVTFKGSFFANIIFHFHALTILVSQFSFALMLVTVLDFFSPFLWWC